MLPTRFWSNWLVAVGIMSILLGAGLAAFYPAGIMAPVREAIQLVFWPDGDAPRAATELGWWLHGIVGSLMMAWGLMVALVAAIPYRREETWAWWALMGSSTLWFCVDSLMSLYLGVGFNVALNAGLFIFIVVPLILPCRRFLQPNRAGSQY